MTTTRAITTPLQAPLCPLCGQPNQCAASAAGSFEVDCWCKAVSFPADLIAEVPAALQGQACICRRCAEAAQAAPEPVNPAAAPSLRPR
jgi:hypothetical protein